MSELTLPDEIKRIVAAVRAQSSALARCRDLKARAESCGELLSRVCSLASCAEAAGLRNLARHAKALEAFLLSQTSQGKRCLLIVDEAQNLTQRAVEELRMLSNFQLGAHPLLQTLLLGQPEFRDTIQVPANSVLVPLLNNNPAFCLPGSTPPFAPQPPQGAGTVAARAAGVPPILNPVFGVHCKRRPKRL